MTSWILFLSSRALRRSLRLTSKRDMYCCLLGLCNAVSNSLGIILVLTSVICLLVYPFFIYYTDCNNHMAEVKHEIFYDAIWFSASLMSYWPVEFLIIFNPILLLQFNTLLYTLWLETQNLGSLHRPQNEEIKMLDKILDLNSMTRYWRRSELRSNLLDPPYQEVWVIVPALKLLLSLCIA